MFAASALKDQTNKAYTIEPVTVELAPYIRLSNHDMVYFVPVNYIDAPLIYQKVKDSGENYIKKDYAWLPVQEIINNKIIKKTDQDQQGTYTFSSGIQKILADYWENILIEMEKKGSAFAQKTVQSDTSWRTIPNSPLSHPVKKQTQNHRKNNERYKNSNLKNSD